MSSAASDVYKRQPFWKRESGEDGDHWVDARDSDDQRASRWQGAARETWEEARARVSNLDLYRVFDVPYISQVYMFYRCELDNGEFGIGPESLETALYEQDQIPWDEIAFPVVFETLKEYFDDVEQGHFPVRVSAIERHYKRSS